jgi:GNAT superfamily N-acetyltransferase
MIVTAPSQDQSKNGPRPINLNTDIPQVLKLLETVFGMALDEEGRRIFTGSGNIGQQPAILWRLSPAASKLATGFVWEHDGRIIGNVTILTTKTPGRYLVVNVAVHPDHRRRGIGRMLMENTARLVRARQGKQILLQVVKSNTAAIALYQNLHYQTLGSMTTWFLPVSRLRQLEPAHIGERAVDIRELKKNEWQQAFKFDQLCLHPDLNWPELLPPDAYKTGFGVRLANFLNGRQTETWVTTDEQNQLIGLANILSEWGRTHAVTIRVHPGWRGRLERPLLAKVIRRLQYLPHRNVRIDHPDDDELITDLLQESNFQPRRTLTHMRLDL